MESHSQCVDCKPGIQSLLSGPADAVNDFRRTHVDADYVGNLATAVRVATARQARAVPMMQASDEFTARFPPAWP